MPLKTQQEQPPELNLTPMVDIVFLLIIFFMVGTKFDEMERSVQLEVPRVGNLGALDPVTAKRIISVYRDGAILLDHRELSLTDLTQELTSAAQAFPDVGVVVRGDAEGTFQQVASVLTACRDAGVSNLEISVKPEHVRR